MQQIIIDVDQVGRDLFMEWARRTYHEKTSAEVLDQRWRLDSWIWHWVAVEAILSYERQIKAQTETSPGLERMQ